MSDEHEQPEKVWDEYDWERFLQQQDLKAERYLELLDRYVDHPERDEIIALEMGWHGADDEDAKVWMAEVDAEFFDYIEEGAADESEGALEVHPLYRLCFELSVWFDDVLEEKGDAFSGQPVILRLSDQICIMGGKLAAALSDTESGEIGMTIAYLKRALRAVTLALGEVSSMQKDRVLGRVRCQYLWKHLFEIRDGIVAMMGTSRAEWRRSQGI